MVDSRWTVRVSHGPGQGRSRAFVRAHSFEAGAPLSFDVAHPRVTALEYLLAALAADLAGGVALVAKRRRVEVDDVPA